MMMIRTSPLESIVLMDSFSNQTAMLLPDVFQTVERVAGESADALGDDHVDVSSHALVDHAVKFITLLCIGATDSVIGEDPWRCSR